MSRNNLFKLLLFTLLLTAVPLTAYTRTFTDPEDLKVRPSQATVTLPYCAAGHNVGRLVLSVNNYGSFGNGFLIGSASDCFTGAATLSCEYPRGSNSYYLFAGAFWIGAVVGRDTLVSAGADGSGDTSSVASGPGA